MHYVNYSVEACDILCVYRASIICSEPIISPCPSHRMTTPHVLQLSTKSTTYASHTLPCTHTKSHQLAGRNLLQTFHISRLCSCLQIQSFVHFYQSPAYNSNHTLLVITFRFLRYVLSWRK